MIYFINHFKASALSENRAGRPRAADRTPVSGTGGTGAVPFILRVLTGFPLKGVPYMNPNDNKNNKNNKPGGNWRGVASLVGLSLIHI